MTDREIASLYWATVQSYSSMANHESVIVAFARRIAEEAVKQERERIALAMDINAGHPCSNEWGDGYNQACRDIVEGLRSRTAVPAKE